MRRLGYVPAMDLAEALRTTGAVREFTDEPVADEVVHRILDTARFAPSGGNRQGWRVVVVRTPDTAPGSATSTSRAGTTTWPHAGRAGALGAGDRPGGRATAPSTGPRRWPARPRPGPGASPSTSTGSRCFCCSWRTCRTLAAVDRDVERYTFAGGASVYPFAWSVLLAARAEGLGGVHDHDADSSRGRR